ncbi:hypothetical protein DNTS_034657 [Danionella cerebrum]|uniref:Matrin-type domain-containing protein n=1 Tax=Danionella cerebrum TaxID=2873325 RepID=A0A553RF47_9TELE|nr:hypothetical protein DNTS_034657 [Danionella translucida]
MAAREKVCLTPLNETSEGYEASRDTPGTAPRLATADVEEHWFLSSSSFRHHLELLILAPIFVCAAGKNHRLLSEPCSRRLGEALCRGWLVCVCLLISQDGKVVLVWPIHREQRLDCMLDLNKMAARFGVVRKTLSLFRRQAMIELKTAENARAMVKYYRSHRARVCGRPVSVSLSHTMKTIEIASGRTVFISGLPCQKFQRRNYPPSAVLNLAKEFGKVNAYCLNRNQGTTAPTSEETSHDNSKRGSSCVCVWPFLLCYPRTGVRIDAPPRDLLFHLDQLLEGDLMPVILQDVVMHSSNTNPCILHSWPEEMIAIPSLTHPQTLSCSSIRADDGLCYLQMDSMDSAKQMVISLKWPPVRFWGSVLKIAKCKKGDSLILWQDPLTDGYLNPGTQRTARRRSAESDQEPTARPTEVNHTNVLRFHCLERIIAVSGFFCKLCNIFFSDENRAKSDHCRSLEHYNKLKVCLLRFLVNGEAKAFVTVEETERTSPATEEI